MIKCMLCDHKGHSLVAHIRDAHGMGEDEYEGETVSPEALAAFEDSVKGTRRTPLSHEKAQEMGTKGIPVTFAGVDLCMDPRVPADGCLPMPAGYVVPKHGRLAAAVRSVAVRVAYGNNKPIWIWGKPGTGKDAVCAAMSARLRRPAIVFNVAPDVDVAAWLDTRAFTKDGTFWEEGPLLRALRDGFMCPDGRRVPYIIVLSDLDRASRGQMEPLRAILDSLGGRIQAQSGMHKVLPGTLVIATANTSGGGDTSGRYSATTVDTSILDRFTFKVLFADMDERDEEPILRAKYPQLTARFPELLGAMMRCIAAIREASDKDEVFIDFGHRTACNWMDATTAEAAASPRSTDWTRILRLGLADVLNGCPNADTAEAVKRLCDPHIKGGVVEEGDTSHINSDPLM